MALNLHLRRSVCVWLSSMATKAMRAAKAKVAGDGLTSEYRDPLDAGGNDKEVVAQQVKDFKDTLTVKNDRNAGIEENEAAFQETVARCLNQQAA